MNPQTTPPQPMPVTPPPQDPGQPAIYPPVVPDNVSPISSDPTKPQAKEQAGVPIGVRILFILNCIGLGGTVLGLILLISIAGSSPIIANLATYLLVFVAVIVAIMFFIVFQIYKGKKWALILYTVIVVLGSVDSLMKSTSSRNVSSILTLILIGYIWYKERDYFR